MHPRTLILFYNAMWGQSLPHHLEMPEGCELTTDRRCMVQADAVVFHIPSLRWLLPRKRPGQVWVAWSIECDVNYPRLRDPGFMRQFDLTMTYQQDSDIRAGYVGYYASAENLARTLRDPPQPKTESAPVVSFISSRFNRSRRQEYVRELARYLRIDSYGKFMRNRKLENDRGRQTKLETIARYKFTLAFENAISRDYVTEKFYDPLVVGSVPIYLGAPNVESFAPGERCFINAADYPSPRALADCVLALDRDDAAYATYLEWKQKPFQLSFMQFLEGQRKDVFARLCERVREMKSKGEAFP